MAQGLSRDINRIQIAFLLRGSQGFGFKGQCQLQTNGTILAAVLAEYVFLSRPLTGFIHMR